MKDKFSLYVYPVITSIAVITIIIYVIANYTDVRAWFLLPLIIPIIYLTKIIYKLQSSGVYK